MFRFYVGLGRIPDIFLIPDIKVGKKVVEKEFFLKKRLPRYIGGYPAQP